MGLFSRRKKANVVQQEMKKTPLYECIKTNCIDGILPNDFSLPQDEEPGKLRFADGAMDGILLFHTGGQRPLDEDGRTKMEELVQLISDTYKDDNEQGHITDETLRAFMKEHLALSVIDEIQQYIRQNDDKLNAENIYYYGIKQMLTSTDKECVKFGLLLLELFTLKNEHMKEILRTFALSDEFTLFVLFIMEQWDNAAEEIFNVAKKVNGWGRVHAVERLEPVTEEIKEWLLYEGINNQILPAYSARTCYEKAEVEKRLFETPCGELSIQDYRSIGMILYEMLEEGPVAGISAVKNRREVLKVYLEHGLSAQKDDLLTAKEYEYISAIKKYLQEEIEEVQSEELKEEKDID